jgi:hypothetical protein
LKKNFWGLYSGPTLIKRKSEEWKGKGEAWEGRDRTERDNYRREGRGLGSERLETQNKKVVRFLRGRVKFARLPQRIAKDATA